MLSFRIPQINCHYVLTLYYIVITLKEENINGEMNMGVLQVRVDDELKNQANAIFEEMGLDLSTAVRMFLKRTVAVRGFPFEMTLDESGVRLHQLITALQKHSEEIGNSEMTLDEINEEIRLAREDRRRKGAK